MPLAVLPLGGRGQDGPHEQMPSARRRGESASPRTVLVSDP